MEVVENITRTTLQEIQKVLGTRTIVGEPVTIEGTTIIPLISIGFAFGAVGIAGKGEGNQKAEGEGQGGGTGGGAWIRPVAIVISDKDGVRVEPVVRGFSASLEKLGLSVPKLVEEIVDKLANRTKKEG